MQTTLGIAIQWRVSNTGTLFRLLVSLAACFQVGKATSAATKARERYCCARCCRVCRALLVLSAKLRTWFVWVRWARVYGARAR